MTGFAPLVLARLHIILDDERFPAERGKPVNHAIHHRHILQPDRS
ncbi:MAG: hypothetical protein ABI876_02525 [Bacteroidota bacterium]